MSQHFNGETFRQSGAFAALSVILGIMGSHFRGSVKGSAAEWTVEPGLHEIHVNYCRHWRPYHRHLAATISEATPLYELCASVLEA